MVKELSRYVGKVHSFGYFTREGVVDKFDARIVMRLDQGGNPQYFIVPCYDCGEPEQRIFSRGNRRVSKIGNDFTIGQDRKWNKALKILNQPTPLSS